MTAHRRTIAIPLVALALLACTPRTGDGAASGGASPSAAVDTVRIDGSPGVQPLVEALARAYRSRVPGATIVVAGGMGSRQRADAVADGRIDIAMASHGVDEAALRARGIAVHEIARTAVVFGVNESVQARGLSRAQVCDIYRGGIRSWQSLGGGDLAVLPLTRPAAEVDAEVAIEGVPCLKTLPTPLAATVVPGADDMARELARSRGAIGMTSMTYVEQSGGRIRALALDGVEPTAENVRSGRWTMTRRSLLLAKADASPEVARFLAFVRSEEGARVIAENGAVAVR